MAVPLRTKDLLCITIGLGKKFMWEAGGEVAQVNCESLKVGLSG
jgi:hypothetical protein